MTENEREDSTFVGSELKVKATASLQAEINKELNIPDPENALSILTGGKNHEEDSDTDELSGKSGSI